MSSRISSVDIFRALTMMLMIFVNDLWSLHGIPAWLEHTKAYEDGMGLADVVFPAFLFIVGLSIPLAIQSRLKKGDSRPRIMIHIATRSLALIVMGFFMVNLETFREDVPGIWKDVWEVAMAIAIFLIWNVYEDKKVFNTIPVRVLQGAGILILVLLALFYRGGTAEQPEWMRPQWWGILGLIGWAYLLCATLYLLSGGKTWIIILCLLVLHLLNVQEFIPFVRGSHGFRLVVGASNHALVMSGVLATLIYLKMRDKNQTAWFIAILLLLGLAYILYGFATRHLWGISKIRATPSWVAICGGISFSVFALTYVVADILKFTRWANPVMPAGRSTLTCYLLPYIIYPVFFPLIRLLPESLTGGLAGIIKSILFALIIIQLTGLLERFRIRLRI